MTLKRNLCEVIDGDSGFDNLHLAEKCEQIADEYAIEFADWLMNLRYYTIAQISTKSLLEEFKKEKGL